MRQTPNYNLPQFDGADFFNKEALNDAFNKIDIGISDMQESINISSGNAGVLAQEIVDARKGKISLKEKIEEIDLGIRNNNSSLEQMARKDDVAKISSGTPLFASSITGMTDVTKNYVNTTDGYLYIYSGGSWFNSNVKYQETGLSEGQVNILKTDFFEKVQLDVVVEYVESQYVNQVDGTFTSGTGYKRSGYLSCYPKSVLEFSLLVNGVEDILSSALNSDFRIAFYDINKNFISGYRKVNRIVVPNNAKFYAFSYNRRLENVIFYIYERLIKKDLLDIKDLEKIKEDIKIIKPTKNIKSIISKLVLSENTLNVKFIGDSITHGVGGTGWKEDGELICTVGNRTWNVNTSGYCWANLAKSYLEEKFNCIVKNYGCSGINSVKMVEGISQIIRSEDNIIICMVGTNDRNEAQGNKQLFYNNLKAIADYVEGLGKEIIFMSSIPASIDNENGATLRMFHMEDVDNIIMKFSSDTNREYISLYKLLIEYCKNNNITIDNLLKDGVHPNDAGHDVMFYLILNALGIATKREGANW